MSFKSVSVNEASCFAVDTVDGVLSWDAISCLAAGDGVAVAIALLFAFCGAVFFAPSVIK